MAKEKFYVTTAIDYVNGEPHIGHALEKIQTDVLARHHRSLGEDVFFLTGTDENSLKNVQAAEKEGIEVQELVERNAKRFYELKEALNLSFDDFIRTTKEVHVEGAQKLWLACKNDIYKKTYQGLYCVGCEEYYKVDELKDGLCPEHKTKPELIKEENYFFKLSKYEKQLREIIKKDELKIIPQTRKNEALSFISGGLEDICISRSKERAHGWGIPVPDDPNQIIWVWFDALSNYITALGYGSNTGQYQKWWEENNNKIHVIGKGILRFHAVYWPGMLLSAKVSLPEEIFVHGYITVDGQKMSKSLGNIIDPFELVEKYGTDAVRHFLLREIPSVEDGDFTYEKFEHRYNSDLAKGLGNLVSRVISLANRLKIDSRIISDNISIAFIKEPKDNYSRALKDFKFNEALKAIWEIVGVFDRYIEREKPWEGGENAKGVISNSLYGLKEIAELLKPFLPETSDRMLEQLKTRKSQPLFSRL